MSQTGTIRPAAVAGRFYPGDAATLASAVADHLAAGDPGRAPRAARAVMAPHAGYVYSGGVAGKVFADIDIPPVVVVLCPNHTGRGVRISVADADAFDLPGGAVPVDRRLADAILAGVTGAQPDLAAHQFEHAIEVELPFLRARRADVAVVPIVVAGLSAADAIRLGEELHDVVAADGRDILVVASSDMSHFLPDDVTRKVDRVALEPLLAYDPAGLYRTVVDRDISMCGYIPATAMLAYCKKAGAAAPELLDYATSGDAFGDRDRVVGYAGVVLPSR